MPRRVALLKVLLTANFTARTRWTLTNVAPAIIRGQGSSSIGCKRAEVAGVSVRRGASNALKPTPACRAPTA
jgi:hypothetical protein